MANIKRKLEVEIDVDQPLQEIFVTMNVVMSYHQPDRQEAILRGLSDLINKRLEAMKNGEQPVS